MNAKFIKFLLTATCSAWVTPSGLAQEPELDEEGQTDVIAALDLLIETLGEEKQRLSQEGAKAMQEADYDTARRST